MPLFAASIELGILVNGEFHAYGRRMGYVQLCKVGSAYTFTDMASAVHYSMWLAQKPIATEWPVALATESLVAA
jgi:hypothetical protein